MATESGLSFLEVDVDMLKNRGASEVRRAFRTARKYAPAVLFIDEIDAIGSDRRISNDTTTLNALLTEMDGFKKREDKPVFVMAATNLRGQIDRALERRFDITFEIGLPDSAGRKWMLKRLIEKHSHMFNITNEQINSIVSRSGGMSFSKIEDLIETLLREAIRSGKKVDDILLDEIFENNRGGAKKPHSLETMKCTAYHESGHALIQLFHNRVPNYMSIVARNNWGGYVQRKVNPVAYFTKEELLENICELLGGRAAELVCGYGLTHGASSDLKAATEIATTMVCRLGMYEDEVGLAVFPKAELSHNKEARKLINQILSEQLQKAKTIITNKKDALERLAAAVMDSKKKSLSEKEIEAVYKGTKQS